MSFLLIDALSGHLLSIIAIFNECSMEAQPLERVNASQRVILLFNGDSRPSRLSQILADLFSCWTSLAQIRSCAHARETRWNELLCIFFCSSLFTPTRWQRSCQMFSFYKFKLHILLWLTRKVCIIYHLLHTPCVVSDFASFWSGSGQNNQLHCRGVESPWQHDITGTDSTDTRVKRFVWTCQP